MDLILIPMLTLFDPKDVAVVVVAITGMALKVVIIWPRDEDRG